MMLGENMPDLRETGLPCDICGKPAYFAADGQRCLTHRGRPETWAFEEWYAETIPYMDFGSHKAMIQFAYQAGRRDVGNKR